MPFRKLTNFDREQDTARTSAYPPSPDSSRFMIADRTFRYTIIVMGSSVSVVLVLLILLRINLHFQLNDADLQALSQITAALGAFMIAIPLFLKDLHKGSIFWRQFFVIACTFILATIAGVLAFLMNTDLQELTANLWLVFAFIVSVDVNVAQLIFSRKRRKRIISIAAGGSSSILLSFAVSLIILGSSAASAAGQPIVVIFILFSLFGFYQTLILIFAVLAQIAANLRRNDSAADSSSDYDRQLRLAIAGLANKYCDHAFTEEELLRRLQKESFPQAPQKVSFTRVELLVTQMDADIDPDHPLVTITTGHPALLIPRWNQHYEALVASSGPLGIFLRYHGSYGFGIGDFMNLLKDNAKVTTEYGKGIMSALAGTAGLSIEFLKENIPWSEKYQLARYLAITYNPYSTSIDTITIVLFLDLRLVGEVNAEVPVEDGSYEVALEDLDTFIERHRKDLYFGEDLEKFFLF